MSVGFLHKASLCCQDVRHRKNAAVIDDKDENVIQDCETEYVAEYLRQKRI